MEEAADTGQLSSPRGSRVRTAEPAPDHGLRGRTVCLEAVRGAYAWAARRTPWLNS
ncbi:hypothetical protein JCM4814A_16080 [Streptomyces phaeofaciens JCM 4814]|uniref:Uncharacterized protein n=1 Tax=Streptomyces phaeofaciens TaxID=68254 RepID=A0A918LTQ1_9ACTN|nr:hypothetical protein GCM10010226_26860 [Streptomyces phaeofaciens]